MATSVERVGVASEANSLASDCGGDATACNRVFVECVNDAIDTSGAKAQALAIDAGLSEFQFSRLRRIDFIDRLPACVQRDIARRFAEALGFIVRDADALERATRVVAAFDGLAREVNALTAVHLRPQMRGRR